MERTILRSALYVILAACGIVVLAGFAESMKRHKAAEEAIVAVLVPATMALAGLAASTRQGRP